MDFLACELCDKAGRVSIFWMLQRVNLVELHPTEGGRSLVLNSQSIVGRRREQFYGSRATLNAWQERRQAPMVFAPRAHSFKEILVVSSRKRTHLSYDTDKTLSGALTMTMTMMATATRPSPELSGLGTSDYPVPIDCASQHHRHLSSSVTVDSSWLQITAEAQCQEHRRWVSASAAPGGAFYIPPPYLSDYQQQDQVNPLKRTRTHLHKKENPGGPVVTTLSYAARRQARLRRQEEKEEHRDEVPEFVRTKSSEKSTDDSAFSGGKSPKVESRVPATSATPAIPTPAVTRRRSAGDEILKPVKGLLRTVTTAVESFQAKHRRSSYRKRISESLLTLRAATELQKEQEEEKDDLSQLVGDVGSALFNPLDPHILGPKNRKKKLVLKHSMTPDILSPEHFEVQILPEPPELLLSNPRILTQEMFQQLVDEGVPECLHMNHWERVYSIGRDGDDFRTMLDHCHAYQYTILAVKTTTGHIFGGFASDPWQEQDGYSKRHAYYGTGLSFLFANHPMLEKGIDPVRDESKELMLFKWTGSNDFSQICDPDKRTIAMGGSGAFGLIIEDSFYKGSTNRCGTFENPPLTPDIDGIFSIQSMEIYGLVPHSVFEPSSPTCISKFDPKRSIITHASSFGSTS